MSSQIIINPSWKSRLISEFNKSYMKNLRSFLDDELKKKKTIYPKENARFRALDITSFTNVKIVIIGQDPYHGPNQAHGLSFSVPLGVPIPRSLLNIYKEIKEDLDIPISMHGCLEEWARQGVLLLNNTLTVEAGKAGSHRGRGWEQFTNQIIHILNTEKENLVFILWGKAAQEKGSLIDSKKHCVLQSAHPSPFSADRGFFGCRHFSKANHYLQSKGIKPIDWSAHLINDKTKRPAK
ncbi:MAG: uracil-DNA glycosylase [Bdellovibrionales bacterium]